MMPKRKSHKVPELPRPATPWIERGELTTGSLAGAMSLGPRRAKSVAAVVPKQYAAFVLCAVNSYNDALSALQACVAMYGDESPDDDWDEIQKARAAIAKMTGTA